jgi:pimeloyl-ACP methyl ester carboxylesterase
MSQHIYKSAAGARLVRQRYLHVLEAWPVANEHLRVPTRHGETFVVTCGPADGPPLVLLHGTGANTAMWMADVTAWAAHFRVYAIDVIGEPGLSAPARPPLASDAYALWLADVMDGLGVERASIAGVSLGGWLALDYAARRPDRVTHLVLLNPSGIGRRKMGFLAKAAFLHLLGSWGRNRTLRLVAGPAAATPPAAGDQASQAFAELALLTFAHFRPRLGAIPTFGDDVLRRLTMPVLLIAGEHDVMLDARETARRLRHAVPHATVTLLPDAGHLLPGQAAAILGFLR